MNITLIGMSGAGKSVIGKRVAQLTGLKYIDVDGELEKAEGKALSEIMEESGYEEFIRLESEISIRSAAAGDHQLISTGGSVIYSFEAMEYLAQISVIVYLAASFSTIASRVAHDPERLSRIVGIKYKSLRQIYNERVPLYEKYALHKLDTDGLSVDQTAEIVISIFHDAQKQRATILPS